MPDISLSGGPVATIVILAGLAVAVLWIVQFAKLMSLDESEFPGPFARFGWVAAFVVLWFLAPFAFLLWGAGKPADRGRRRPARSDAD